MNEFLPLSRDPGAQLSRSTHRAAGRCEDSSDRRSVSTCKEASTLKRPVKEPATEVRKSGGNRVVPVSCYPLLALGVPLGPRAHGPRSLIGPTRTHLGSHPNWSCREPSCALTWSVRPRFVAGGQKTADYIAAALAMPAPQRAKTVLDFGCGSAGGSSWRRLRRWPQIGGLGSDVGDERGIQRVREAPGRARCVLVSNSAHFPPSRARWVHLIWRGSVFTHLDEDRQDAWLAELVRMPGSGRSSLGKRGPATAGTDCLWLTRDGSRARLRLTPPVTRESIPTGIRRRGTRGTISNSHWSQFIEIDGYIPIGSVCRRRCRGTKPGD